MAGWIKLHRSIIDSTQFANPVDLKIWVWLLCRAAINDKNVSLKIGRGVTTVRLLRGQLIFGRNKAEELLGIDGSTIYKVLQKMVADKSINVESNNQYSIITIRNYNDFQDNEDDEFIEFEESVTTKEQPSNNQVTAEEQPSNSGVTQIENTNNNREGIRINENEQGVTPAENAGVPAGGLFEDQTVKKEKKKKTDPAVKKENSELRQKLVDIYFAWHVKEVGVDPVWSGREGGAQGKAMNDLMKYMLIQTSKKMPQDGQGIGEKEINEAVVNSWSTLLEALGSDRIEPFFRSQTKITQIYSNLNSIIHQLKHGNPRNINKGKQGGNTADLEAELARELGVN